jgi:streptogramin lyase
MALVAQFFCSAVRGDFLVTSDLTDEVLRYSNNGGSRGAFVTSGSGGLNSPQALAWGPDGNLYVGTNGPVKKYDSQTGAFLGDLYTPPPGQVYGILFAPDGDLLVSVSNFVQRVDLSTGSATKIPIGGYAGKLVLTPDGNVLVGNGEGSVNAIKRIDLSNNTVTTFASGGGLFGPFGLEYGPDGKIYTVNLYGTGGNVAATGIYQVDPISGAVLGRWAEAGLTAPADLMFIEGNRLWISSVITDQLNLLDARTGEFIKSVPGGSHNWDMLHMPEPNSTLGFALAAVLGCARRRNVAMTKKGQSSQSSF